MSNKETREKLDELFSKYNSQESIDSFNFPSFFGFCQGTLMVRETISIDMFIQAVEHGMEVGKIRNGLAG